LHEENIVKNQYPNFLHKRNFILHLAGDDMAGKKPTYEELRQKIIALETESLERKRVEEDLRYRNTIFEAVGFAAQRFLWAVSLEDENLQDVLERLGQATGVSRVYIFENRKTENGVLLVQRYKWITPLIAAKVTRHELQDLPADLIPFKRWKSRLGSGQIIQGQVRDFPKNEQKILKAQGVVSYRGGMVGRGRV